MYVNLRFECLFHLLVTFFTFFVKNVNDVCCTIHPERVGRVCLPFKAMVQTNYARKQGTCKSRVVGPAYSSCDATIKFREQVSVANQPVVVNLLSCKIGHH